MIKWLRLMFNRPATKHQTVIPLPNDLTDESDRERFDERVEILRHQVRRLERIARLRGRGA